MASFDLTKTNLKAKGGFEAPFSGGAPIRSLAFAGELAQRNAETRLPITRISVLGSAGGDTVSLQEFCESLSGSDGKLINEWAFPVREFVVVGASSFDAKTVEAKITSVCVFPYRENGEIGLAIGEEPLRIRLLDAQGKCISPESLEEPVVVLPPIGPFRLSNAPLEVAAVECCFGKRREAEEEIPLEVVSALKRTLPSQPPLCPASLVEEVRDIFSSTSFSRRDQTDAVLEAIAQQQLYVSESRSLATYFGDEHSRGAGWRPVLVVAADGAHTPTRPETGKREGKRGAGSWQEAKGFRMYLIGQDRIEQVMSWHQIATEEEFGQALRFAATLIPQEKVRIGLLGDGAKGIWSHMTAAFPKGKEILDYFHCSEHVHKLAEIQYPKDEHQQAMWIESTMARLYFGDVESVIWGLQRMQPPTAAAKKEIQSLIGYLRGNSHRINYRSTKRAQYPSGSGGIESANKFICHKRMKVSGAWWYKINGNRMLRIRCSIYNGTFDQVFAQYKRAQVRAPLTPEKVSRIA